MNAASPPEVTNALRTTRSTSDRNSIMLRAFHSRKKLFNPRVNDRASFIRASKFFHRVHRIEAKQRDELHLIAIFANEQFGATITCDVSPSDARENFVAQHVLILLCVCWFGPAVPNPRDHHIPIIW